MAEDTVDNAILIGALAEEVYHQKLTDLRIRQESRFDS